MIDALLKVADILLGRRDKLREADADRRRRVALYFENVSRCLHDIASELKSGAEPNRACRELYIYACADDVVDNAKGEMLIATVFGEETARQLEQQLEMLVRVPHGAIFELSIRKSRIFHRGYHRKLEDAVIKIEAASGKFKALAVLTLASEK